MGPWTWILHGAWLVALVVWAAVAAGHRPAGLHRLGGRWLRSAEGRR
jgi:hypothetical protein